MKLYTLLAGKPAMRWERFHFVWNLSLILLMVTSTQISTKATTYFNHYEVTITGKVTDNQGESLPGVNIVVKDKPGIGTATEVDGSYSLTVDDDVTTLVFSYIGFKTQEIEIGNRTVIDVIMESDQTTLDEVVIVGYGSQTKASLTGAVSNIKSEALKEIPTSNMSTLLAGRMSGVYVNNWTGTPGVSSAVNIRARSSFTSTPAIYVIDGVVRDKRAFDELDPNEIKEISVLKDAASAALYGSRSSGGVVLVATENGEIGKPEISFTATHSFDKPTNLPEMMSAVDILDMGNSYADATNPNHWWYKDDSFRSWMASVNDGYGYDYIFGENGVWTDPNNQRYALSVKGGTEKIKYYIGGSFYDQQGWIETLKYDKFNLRANVTAQVARNLEASLNLSQVSSNREKFNWRYDWGSDELGDLWKKLQTWQFYWPLTIEGKPWNYGWLGNIGELLNGNSGSWGNKGYTQNAIFSLKWDVPFVDGLSLKGTYSGEAYNSRTKLYTISHTLWNVEGNDGDNYSNAKLTGTTVQSNTPFGYEFLQTGNSHSRATQINVQANYARSFGNHNLNAFLVYEQWEEFRESVSGGRRDFDVIKRDQYFATSSDAENSWFSGSEGQNGRLGWIGQARYDFAHKYLLTASFRYDASLNFAPDKRWGFFPAVSAAWVISEEPFFQTGFMDYLKLRGSFGVMGNDNIGGWRWLESYNANASGFHFGQNPSSTKGLAYGGIVNPDVTWEKSKTINLGIDASFLENFSLTAEYYTKNTFDILGSRIQSIPTTFGGNLPPENYGEVHSKGVEFELGYNNRAGSDFNYYGRFNYGFGTNEVKVWDQPEGVRDYQDRIGRPLGFIAGYVDNGMFRTQADLDALPEGYTLWGSEPQLGWLNYKDLSGPDGTPDGKIDNWDQKVLSDYGSAPSSFGLTLGFDWKGFNVEAFFQGLFGHQKYINVQPPFPWTRTYKYWDDYWSPDNPNASMPHPNWNYWQNRVTSPFHLRSGAFTRLRYVNIGYNIPADIIGKVGLSNARIFASGTNLLTFTKFDTYDPELGHGGVFPISKSFTTGISLTF